MSPIKFKPLLAATVMSAIYMAGIPTTSQAAVQNKILETKITQEMQPAAKKGSVDYVIPAAVNGVRRYIVEFEKEPVARVHNLSDKVGMNSATTQAYIAELKNDQTVFEQKLPSVLSSMDVKQKYILSYNGIALYMLEKEASLVEAMPGVKRVILDKDYVLNTDAGPKLIGADNLWNGTNPDVGTATGEGMVVGIIDSGINSGHPSFADTDADGYVHTNPLGAGNYLGACDPGNVDQYIPAFTCNSKLIGGYDFVFDLVDFGAGDFDIEGPEDEGGHGSHTSSTAAGNKVDNVPYVGQNLTISGVARQANVIMYDACYEASDGRGLCPGVSTLKSVEQAIEDGIVDVINYYWWWYFTME